MCLLVPVLDCTAPMSFSPALWGCLPPDSPSFRFLAIPSRAHRGDAALWPSEAGGPSRPASLPGAEPPEAGVCPGGAVRVPRVPQAAGGGRGRLLRAGRPALPVGRLQPLPGCVQGSRRARGPVTGQDCCPQGPGCSVPAPTHPPPQPWPRSVPPSPLQLPAHLADVETDSRCSTGLAWPGLGPRRPAQVKAQPLSLLRSRPANPKDCGQHWPCGHSLDRPGDIMGSVSAAAPHRLSALMGGHR